ncbi:hypothetical protein GCM10010232_70960 [Streptomyces amakusaensis]
MSDAARGTGTTAVDCTAASTRSKGIAHPDEAEGTRAVGQSTVRAPMRVSLDRQHARGRVRPARALIRESLDALGLLGDEPVVRPILAGIARPARGPATSAPGTRSRGSVDPVELDAR